MAYIKQNKKQSLLPKVEVCVTVINLPQIQPHKGAQHGCLCGSACWYKTLSAKHALSVVGSTIPVHRTTAFGSQLGTHQLGL